MSEISAETKQILLSISNEQWLIYFNRLAIYADKLCKRWIWRTGNRENLPRGYSPEAIATEAIKRLYHGQRIWNHDVYPGDNPVPFLESVIKSIVSEIGRSSDHKHAASLEGESKRINDDGESYEREIRAADGAVGFRPQLELLPDQRAYFEEIDHRIDDAIADRDDLVQFYNLFRKGFKRNEIAEKMHIEVEQCDVLRRLFLRRTKHIQEELFGEND